MYGISMQNDRSFLVSLFPLNISEIKPDLKFKNEIKQKLDIKLKLVDQRANFLGFGFEFIIIVLLF